MSTIADALNDIQRVQSEIQATLGSEGAPINDRFISDLLSFTTARFFDLCAHVVLDTLRGPIGDLGHPYAQKYYSLFAQRPILDAEILWSNHSGLFSLWNIFERYIRTKAERLRLTYLGRLDVCYKNILKKQGIQGTAYQHMLANSRS